ncbi:MAG TPA: glycosyltransferase [Chitinophagaceae bacterium]|nr:glycosyltransferase [Chitinophagaceae bacterium]
MTEGKDEKLRRKIRILVAPLDWGLGHTTRCIPIVKEFLANDCDVWLAGDSIQEVLLRSEFPGLPFLSLPGYNIQYAKNPGGLLWKLILQAPRIISSLKAEHRWLRRAIENQGYDAVISDNRFGLYHSSVPCVFLTHQLSIESPLGRWNETILQKLNYKYVNRFTECWVPDLEGENNLAGKLSHPTILPRVPVKYIDPLSRFEKKELSEIEGRLLFILSGPEPQRTILENKIINEVSHYPGTAAIVRGLPSSQSVIPSSGMIKVYNHLSARELNEEMEKADWVISRSGYSTIMDLAKLQKKSILIPTPGQTEQEYLAESLLQKKEAYTVEQKQFVLNAVVDEAKKFNHRFSSLGHPNRLRIAVRNFLDSIMVQQ